MEGNFKWLPFFPKTGKRWARVITEYDATKRNVFRFVGDKWLKQGTVYSLPVGSMVLAYEEDTESNQFAVRLYRIDNPDQHCLYSFSANLSKTTHWLKLIDGDVKPCESSIYGIIFDTWGSNKYSESKYCKPQPEPDNPPMPTPNGIITYDEVKTMGTKMIEFIQSSKNKDEATKTAMLLYVLYNSAKNARESRR